MIFYTNLSVHQNVKFHYVGATANVAIASVHTAHSTDERIWQ